MILTTILIILLLVILALVIAIGSGLSIAGLIILIPIVIVLAIIGTLVFQAMEEVFVIKFFIDLRKRKKNKKD